MALPIKGNGREVPVSRPFNQIRLANNTNGLNNTTAVYVLPNPNINSDKPSLASARLRLRIQLARSARLRGRVPGALLRLLVRALEVEDQLIGAQLKVQRGWCPRVERSGGFYSSRPEGRVAA